MARVLTLIVVFFFVSSAFGQQDWATHTRGKLWETIYNYGFIGSPVTWEYWQTTGVGFYPGFSGYTFPNDEILANGFITDANFHNFRSGPIIVAKDALTRVPPEYQTAPVPYLTYHSSLANGEEGVLATIPPFQRIRNFVENDNYNPLMAEEINRCWFHTATGITVYQKSYAWSFPGYSDFIIYDYTFKNTGKMVFTAINDIKDLEQTLNEVWIVFHSGIQSSTKGNLNFHYDPDFLSSAAPAGGFGYHPEGGYTDYYAIENDGPDGEGLLFYSYDYNGGREPVPWDPYQLKNNWEEQLRIKPEWPPELQDPACFGFVFLEASPPTGAAEPFEPDPVHFSVYSDEMDQFDGRVWDSMTFGLNAWSEEQFYKFITTDYKRPNDGNAYCWYTGSFGPYTLAPGDSVRLVVAEVAGMLDLHEVISGDTTFQYPDSSIAAIRRNTEAARKAYIWGYDVPDSPPAPVCRAATVSAGSDTAIITVQWEKNAEEAVFSDGSGATFYDGAVDLSGYRIFRGIDKRGVWELVKDIPRSEFTDYWNPEISQYEYRDMDLQFGFEFYYYVQAYNSDPNTWTSKNGQIVDNLGELASADYNKTPLIGARPGPVSLNEGWDVFVTPNPYVEGDPLRSFGEPTPNKIEFRNLPDKAVIKIFTLSGDLVKTLSHGPDELGNQFGSIAWDQRTESGLMVAPGLYIYVVESRSKTEKPKSRTRGKLMIIR